jgi:DNA-directed RNA polymerase subunit alpha
VASIDAATGAIRTLRRTERRMARIEPRHPELDSAAGIDSHYGDLEEIERQERGADAARVSLPERARPSMERAAKRAFLQAMELGADPWGDVVAAVLAVSHEAEQADPADQQDWRSTKVEHLSLDRRSRNCVLATDARTVGDLAAMTDGELMRIPNLGRRSLDEIRGAISALQTGP